MTTLNMNLGLIFILIVYNVYIIHGLFNNPGLSDTSFEWSQCRRHTYQRHMYMLSLSQCWEQCALRPRCEAVNYWRRSRVCDIVFDLNGVLVPLSLGPCVRLQRVNQRSGNCARYCRDVEACDTNEGRCVVKGYYDVHLWIQGEFSNGNWYFNNGSRLELVNNGILDQTQLDISGQGSSSCIHISNTRQVTNIDCSSKHGFICEK